MTVVSDEAGTTVADLGERGLLTLAPAPGADDDNVLDGAALLVPATGDPDQDRRRHRPGRPPRRPGRPAGRPPAAGR